MLKNLLLKGRVILGLFCCLLLSMAASAQTRITGKVIGADDRQPVIGASVRLKGTTFGTVTDANGNFGISAARGQVLTISYIGYQSQDVTIGASTTLSVTLATNQNSLNEVVVTGYTTQLKKDISGSVATVNVSAAKQLATASSDQLLQGQAAGVTVVTQGNPGSDAQVYIRGIGNFQNSQPLYVIDGVQTNSMRDINPNDIESISVLKDAVGTAQYGVSGGNGVVLITTKKGKGKSTISYDAYYGTQRPLPGNPLNLLGADEFTSLLNLADPTNPLLINGKYAAYGYQGAGAKGVTNSTTGGANPALYKFDPQNSGNDYLIQQFATGAGTDWFHAIFKPAPFTSHSLSASGANDKNSYFLSFNYLNQNGTLLNSFYKRYSARVNTTFNIKDHIRIGETAQAYFTSTPGGYTNLDEGNAVSYTYRIQPNIPIYDIGGNYGGTYAGIAQLGNANNPVAIRERVANNTNKNWEVIATGFAEADFLKHFTARTSYNIRFNNYYFTYINPNPYESGENHAVPANYGEGSGFNSTYNWTNTVQYAQIFGKHNLKVLAGYEQQDNYNRNISGQGLNPFSIEPDYVSLSNTALANRTINSGLSYFPTSRQSEFARLDYQYNDKYILGATVRRDGYSAFFTGRKYGTFPAFSLAWRISQEDFMKQFTWINDLKLRGSYGLAAFAGNTSGANAFTLYSQRAGVSFYPIDGSYNTPTLGFYNSQLGNRNTTWETDKTLNFGFDGTFFGNKLDVTAEYFVKTSSDFLFQVTLPATLGGAAPPFVNLGEIKNKGFEASATYHIRPSSDLSFDISANFTTYKNRITDLPFNVPTAGSRIGTIVRNELGHSVGEFYGYKQIGYFSSAADVAASPTQAGAAPGAFKFADLNGDKVIDDKDRTYIGNPNPKFNYGLNLSAKYKNIDILATLYGVYGNKVFNYVKYFTEFYTTFPGNKNKDALYNSWTPTNLNPAAVNQSLPSSFSTDQQVNSYYVESGSFLKLRTLQIGYTFSPSLLKAVSIDRLRIYLQGANLFTITKYKGLDPEIQATGGNQNAIGIDYGNYPNNERRYLIGVNLSF
ncbi:SusC/RagA family TonB-linked outer membrane protein [Mucilaginibacter sp.]